MMNEQMREALDELIQDICEMCEPPEDDEQAVRVNLDWLRRKTEEMQSALSSQSEAQPVLYMARNLHSNSYATSRSKAEAELYLAQSGLKNDGIEAEVVSLRLAPPSAKAIETAALMKAAEVAERQVGGRAGKMVSEEILALITPEDKTALEEFGIKCIEVALQLPEHLRIQHNLRASVKQVMEGEK